MKCLVGGLAWQPEQIGLAARRKGADLRVDKTTKFRLLAPQRGELGSPPIEFVMENSH